MHILQASLRNGNAQNRMTDAARKLAAQFSLPADLVSALSVQQKDPLVKSIMLTEATADLLEAVFQATAEPTPANKPALPAEKVTAAPVSSKAKKGKTPANKPALAGV